MFQISVWHEQKAKEPEASRQKLFISCFKIQIHPLLGKTKKLYALQFYQLKTENGAIRTF